MVVSYFTFTLPVVSFLQLNWMVVSYFTFTLPVVTFLRLNWMVVSCFTFTLPVVNFLLLKWMVVSYFIFTLPVVTFLLLRLTYFTHCILNWPDLLSFKKSVTISVTFPSAVNLVRHSLKFSDPVTVTLLPVTCHRVSWPSLRSVTGRR